MSKSPEPTFNLDAFVQLVLWIKQEDHRCDLLNTLSKEDPENHRRVKVELERLRSLARPPEPAFDIEAFIADWLSTSSGCDKLGQLQYLQPKHYYAVLAHLKRVFEATTELNASVLAVKFLRWPLPESVCADGCATVHGATGRFGTNLLNFPEAKQMFEDVLGLKDPSACSAQAADKTVLERVSRIPVPTQLSEPQASEPLRGKTTDEILFADPEDAQLLSEARAREDAEIAKLAGQVNAERQTIGVDWGVEHVLPEVLVQALRICVGLDPEHTGNANTFEYRFSGPDADAVAGELLESLRLLGIAPASREEMQASKLHSCLVKWGWVALVKVTLQPQKSPAVERLRVHILEFADKQRARKIAPDPAHELMLKSVDRLRGIKMFSCAHMTDAELLDKMISLQDLSKRLEANWQKRGISFNTTLEFSRNPVPPLSGEPPNIAAAVQQELSKYADPDFGKVRAAAENLDRHNPAAPRPIINGSQAPETITTTPAVMIECIRALLFTKKTPMQRPAHPHLKEAELVLTWHQFAELSCQLFLLEVPTDCITFAAPETFDPIAAEKLYSVRLKWSAAQITATRPGRDCALWQHLCEATEWAAPTAPR